MFDKSYAITLAPGHTFSGCCGSYYGGKITKKDASPKSSHKGIALWEGECKRALSTRLHERKTIETKNGPITVMVRKVWK